MQFEKMTTICTIFISVLALLVSFNQSDIAREHNQLATKPYIQVHPSLTGSTKKDGIKLANDGMGTAFIKATYLLHKGVEYDFSKNSWPKFLKANNLNPDCFKNRWLKKGAAIKQGDSINFISGSSSQIKGCEIESLRLLTLEGMRLRIEYESVYGIPDVFDDTISIPKSDLGEYGYLIDMIKKI